MNKILFIVEGLNDEVKFINRLFAKCNKLQKYEIVPYKTNLHNLANQIVINDEIDENLDIRLVLREKEKIQEQRDILSQNFSDIILVFDFEPQQDIPRFNLIRKLLLFFNKSTENGKLYINYPMMQSYRHFNKLPDLSFKNRIIAKEDAHNYKEIVNNFSKFKNIDHHSYSFFISIAYHHLLKLNYISTGNYSLPGVNFIYKWEQVDLFDIQYKKLTEDGNIFVINTFSLFIIEFNATEFYNQITTHKSRYSI